MKKVIKIIKLQILAGKANPAPPIGPALGSAGVNIMNFCQQFNARTQAQVGEVLPVIITVFHDKTFEFEVRKPPVPYLILSKLGLKSGSKTPNKDKVGSLTMQQVKEIAELKFPDFQVRSLESAMKMVIGSAKSMGIDVIG